VGSTPRMNRTLKVRAAVERMRVSLWFAPAFSILAVYAAASFVASVRVSEQSWIRGVVFGGGAESARQLLATVAGSMITVTGVVFSLTVVALQLASTQYSPRVLRNFLRDAANQIVLAVFLATFAWAIAVLPTIRVAQGGQEEYVPRLAVTLGTVLVGLSLGMLVFFIHRLTTSIRIESIMRDARHETIETIDRIHPIPRPEAPDELDVPQVPGTATAIAVPRSGYLQQLDTGRLVRGAVARDLVISIKPTVGEHVVQGTVLGWVWHRNHEAGQDDAVRSLISSAANIGFERTMQEDVGFGIRQLTDIAVKALSPGVNDPTSAVDAVAHLSVIMACLAQRDLDHRVFTDDDHVVRLAVPRPTFSIYLRMSVGQIRRYATREPAVLSALVRLLTDVATTSADEKIDRCLDDEAKLIWADAERDVAQPADLEMLTAHIKRLQAALECRRSERALPV
jgi:uncharacterized membrane protein